MSFDPRSRFLMTRAEPELCRTEAEEIADNIVAAFGTKPGKFDDARLLVTRYMGTPADVGHQLHDNIADALLR